MTGMRENAFKYFEGRASKTERYELLSWLRNKENRNVFNSFRLDWRDSLDKDRFPGGGGESWNQLQARLGQKSYLRWQKSRRMEKFFRVAAIFFFVLTVGSLAWFLSRQSAPVPETFTRVVSENGQVSKVELPDGSVVWLNSGSTISYNNYFSADNREIALSGEAYFDVAKNEEIPLVVDFGELKVKVLGTRFNINAYDVGESAEVVLEDGSVELINEKSAHSFYQLKPGERINVELKTNRYSVKKVNTTRYTSWKDGIINIYDLPLEEVIMRLEKRYNQQFELDPEVNKFRYTFTIENERLEDVLNLMERITPVKVKQTEEIIKIELDREKLKKAGS
jgi:transmembrane sensor